MPGLWRPLRSVCPGAALKRGGGSLPPPHRSAVVGPAPHRCQTPGVDAVGSAVPRADQALAPQGGKDREIAWAEDPAFTAVTLDVDDPAVAAAQVQDVSATGEHMQDPLFDAGNVHEGSPRKVAGTRGKLRRRVCDRQVSCGACVGDGPGGTGPVSGVGTRWTSNLRSAGSAVSLSPARRRRQAQEPRNVGVRFSAKAARPSLRSALSKVRSVIWRA